MPFKGQCATNSGLNLKNFLWWSMIQLVLGNIPGSSAAKPGREMFRLKYVISENVSEVFFHTDTSPSVITSWIYTHQVCVNPDRRQSLRKISAYFFWSPVTTGFPSELVLNKVLCLCFHKYRRCQIDPEYNHTLFQLAHTPSFFVARK